MNNTQEKFFNIATKLCYILSALAVLLSLNSYFRIVPVIDYVHLGNAHVAFIAQFLAISMLYMLLFLLVMPHLKEQNIFLHLFKAKCQIGPFIPVLFFASGYYHIAYLTLLIVHAAFFLTNEICFQKKLYPNGNYYCYKILVTIGFVSNALIIHSVNTLQVLF